MTETPDPRYPDADRGFEIRVSPDERNVAIYDPGNAPWFVPVDRGQFVRTAEYGGLDAGDLVWDLEQAGFTLPSPEEAARALSAKEA